MVEMYSNCSYGGLVSSLLIFQLKFHQISDSGASFINLAINFDTLDFNSIHNSVIVQRHT